MLKEMAKHYYQVRYPDFVKHKYNRQVAEETLSQTKEFYQWLKEKIIKN
jgi:HEPN domain-containing protein